MKVLSIGTDRKLFEDKSAVFRRSVNYSEKMGELHVVVFTLRKEGHKLKKINNLYIYPTNSLSQWLYVWDAYELCKKLIIENKLTKSTSVISTQDPFQTGFVGVCLSKKFHLPLQLQVHTDFFSEHFSKSFLNMIRRMIASFVIPRAEGIRVVNKTIKDSIERRFPSLANIIEVLPVFIDIEKITSTEPKKDIKKDFPQFKFVIFMASRLTEEKRIDVALKMLKKITAGFPQIGLIISGTGPEKDNLENLIRKLGLSGNVVFLGWQDDLISIYKTANLFLLTSEYEGYGMTLVEAGASGCPIVTTNVGIAKTSLFKNGENSFICPVGDVDCLSKAVVDLMENPKKRELFKEKMQASIKSTVISKDKYTAQYIVLLENLLKNV